MNKIRQYLYDFCALFFPEICSGCGKPLIYQEKLICTDCLYHLPYTQFHIHPENPVARQLWGRVHIEGAASYLYFSKASRTQRIIYQLKYKNTPQLGELLGEHFGEQLAEAVPYSNAEMIVPIPLHPHKLRKRGYNQTLHIAVGLSKRMGIPVIANNLVRHSHNESQTKKNRHERYINTKDIFTILRHQEFVNRTVLLVDDVFTTGATMEACAAEFLKIEGTKIVAVTLAHGK